MVNTIVSDTVRSGHLIDGDPDPIVQSCTLTYEPGVGPVLAVPYIVGNRQFASVQHWFHDRDVPTTLLYADNLGELTFSGTRWRGRSGASTELGKVDADVVILGRPKAIKPEYRFEQFSSRIDGLEEFCGFRSITDNLDDPSREHVVTFTVDANEQVSWRYGGFTHTIRATAPWTTNGREVNARSEVIISSHRARGATVNEHLVAQWPIRALLLLVLGNKIHWRKHWILDKQFPMWMLSGDIHEPTTLEVLPRRTVRDREQPAVEHADLMWPLFGLRDLKSTGLRKWMKLHEDPVFRRAIEPTAEVINGVSNFLEPRLMMLALALDAMGHFRDPDRKRNTRMQTQILRCISASGLDLSRIGSAKGVAIAISNMNNDIKHADRPNRPDSLELGLSVDLATLILRLQLFDLLDLPRPLHESALQSRDVNFLFERFRINGVQIDDEGQFIRA